MPEFRYTGKNVNGKLIQGTLFSPDSKTAKAKLQKVVKAKGIRIDNIEQKSVFVYKVQRGTEKPLQGEQKAFSEEELHNALTKMGYRVFYVRKKLFNFKFKVPTKDLVLFIRICADLLREKFPYDEILTLVGSDTDNRRLRETISDIQKDLKAGNEGDTVFSKHADVFGRFTCHMLAVASTSGNMAEIYESTAKFLEREEEFRSNLRSVLIMPIVVVVAMIAAMGFYVIYIFPKMTDMLIKHDIAIPPLTKATLDLSQFLQSYWFYIFAAIVIPFWLFLKWIRTEKGRYNFDRVLIRVPILGSIMHKTSIEIFSRVLYSLYSSSGENIAAIRVAAESCRNKYIEKQITGIVLPTMLREGRSFVECLNRTNCFTLTAVRRLRSGEESGTLRQSARQLANYYEKENKHKMAGLVDVVNILISVVITIMIIALTIVSSEIGFVSPASPLSR